MYFNYIIRCDIIQVQGDDLMIISLCGDEYDKQMIIQELQKVYGNKLLVINYFKEVFDERIDNTKLRNSLLLEEFNKRISEIVQEKIDEIIKNNQDKIIVLISNNILEVDIDKLPWFKLSKIKILVTSDKKNCQNDMLWGHQVLYNNEAFDYVINSQDKVSYRKLVREL